MDVVDTVTVQVGPMWAVELSNGTLSPSETGVSLGTAVPPGQPSSTEDKRASSYEGLLYEVSGLDEVRITGYDESKS